MVGNQTKSALLSWWHPVCLMFLFTTTHTSHADILMHDRDQIVLQQVLSITVLHRTAAYKAIPICIGSLEAHRAVLLYRASAYAALSEYVLKRRRAAAEGIAAAAQMGGGGGTVLHQLPDFLIPYLIQVWTLPLVCRLSMQLHGCLACAVHYGLPIQGFQVWTTR